MFTNRSFPLLRTIVGFEALLRWQHPTRDSLDQKNSSRCGRTGLFAMGCEFAGGGRQMTEWRHIITPIPLTMMSISLLTVSAANLAEIWKFTS